MRDNRSGMPEILAAHERADAFYGIVRPAYLFGSYEFGVDEGGYRALRGILQSKPFATTPGIPHRYFLTGSFSRRESGQERICFAIRIEAEAVRLGGTFDFVGPVSLVSNLLWFQKLTTAEEVAHLKAASAV